MAMNTTDKIKSCFKQFKTYLSVLGGLYLNELPQRLIQYGTQLSEQLILHIYLLLLLLLASPKKNNKQTERTLAGTPQQLWPITAVSHGLWQSFQFPLPKY